MQVNIITIEELKRELKNNFEHILLISVLKKEDFIDCNIAGSISIPLDQFLSKIDTLDRSKKIIVHCTSNESQSSIKAYNMLENAGFKNIYDYRGGIREWIETGQEATNGICSAPYLNKDN
jgi:rhodanese-related sulfurtransferase